MTAGTSTGRVEPGILLPILGTDECVSISARDLQTYDCEISALVIVYDDNNPRNL